MLPPYLQIPVSDKLRGQFVTIEILVPKDKRITFGENIDRVLITTSIVDINHPVDSTIIIHNPDGSIIEKRYIETSE